MGPLARGARGSPGDVGKVYDRQKCGAPGTRFLALRLAAASRRQGIVEGFGGVLRARQRACGARVGNRVAVRAVVGVRVQAVVVDGGATAFASSPPRAPRPPVDAPCGGVGRARGAGAARRGGGQRRARHRRWGGRLGRPTPARPGRRRRCGARGASKGSQGPPRWALWATRCRARHHGARRATAWICGLPPRRKDFQFDQSEISILQSLEVPGDRAA